MSVPAPRFGPIEGRLVRLEPISMDHVEPFLAAVAEDPTLYQWSGAPKDRAAAERYLHHAVHDPAAAAFALVRRADGVVVGSSRLSHADTWTPGRDHPEVCELGHTWLSASALRTGINREAKLLLLTQAFEGWRVERVRIVADARNARSRAAIEALGFTHDGVLRVERLGHDGLVRDTAFHSMLAAEWPAAKARIEASLAAHAAP